MGCCEGPGWQSARDYRDRRRTPAPAERHADQVDRFFSIPIFLGIALFPYLVYGLSGGGPVVFPVSHLEFEHEHLTPVEHHHVRPAPA